MWYNNESRRVGELGEPANLFIVQVGIEGSIDRIINQRWFDVIS